MQRRNFIRNLALTTALLEFFPRTLKAYHDHQQRLSRRLSKTGDDLFFWKNIKDEFLLDPGLLYFNTGSLGPTPTAIVQAVDKFTREMERDPVGNMWSGDLNKQMEAVRQLAANFLGASLEEILVTSNTTEGMNLIALSLDLKPGDEILTTNHEHGGGMICWQYLAKYKRVKIRYMEIPVPVKDKAQILQLVKDNLNSKTRICSFMHIDTITGDVMPLKEISEMLAGKNILLIADGAQAPGMLDVNVRQLGVDAYCSSSHKWLLAPKGSGILYIKKESQERIKPIAGFSGFNVYSASVGTRNLPQIIGHGLSMDFHMEITKAKVEARCKELCNLLKSKLDEISQLTRLTSNDAQLASGMVTYSVNDLKASEVFSRLLNEKRCRVKVAQGTYAYVQDQPVTPGNHNALRFSTHIFNNEEEIEGLVSAVRAVI